LRSSLIFKALFSRRGLSLFLILFSPCLFSATQDLTSFSTSKDWLKLVHYHRSLFSGYKSDTDGKKFFLHPEGKTSPLKELQATIESFYQKKPTGPDEHALCRFPARFELLKKYQLLDLAKVAKPQCPKLDRFLLEYKSEQVSLVFSSYYVESPASIFGHTLLRFKKTDDFREGRHFELLDAGVGFGANATTDNAILYTFMGLVGGFEGVYTGLPYFYKIREYNDYESRDLWSYDLNFSPAEITFMIQHLWELSQTYFDYFYFTENCSYQLVALFEAVRPSLEIFEKLPFYIIPIDTVKAVAKSEGLLNNVSIRISQRKKLNFRYEKLDAKQIDAFNRIRKNEKLSGELEALDNPKKVEVLDAVIDYIDFAFADDILKERGEKKDFKNEVLSARSQYQIPSHELPPQNLGESPHLSHGSHRASIFGRYDEMYFGGVDYRFALHDRLDPSQGQAELATLEFGYFRLGMQEASSSVKIEEIRIIGLSVISPWSDFSKKLSFDVDLGMKYFDCQKDDLCFAPHIEVGAGSAVKLTSYLFFSFLIDNHLAIHRDLDKSAVQYGLGPRLRMNLMFNPLVIEMNASYLKAIVGDFHHREIVSAESRFHFGKTAAIGLQGEWVNNQLSGQSNLYFYY
jgi:hypothetical protein